MNYIIRQIYWLISWAFVPVRILILSCLLFLYAVGHYAEWGYDWCDEKLPAPPIPKWLIKFYRKRNTTKTTTFEQK